MMSYHFLPLQIENHYNFSLLYWFRKLCFVGVVSLLSFIKMDFTTMFDYMFGIKLHNTAL